MAEDGGLYYSEGNDALAAFNTKFYAVKISKIF